MAVVGRFAGHVSKIDTLVEHVARNGRLGRRNPQTLAEDATVIRAPRAMPQQTPIAFLEIPIAAGETIFLAISFNAEDVDDLQDSEPQFVLSLLAART